MSAQRHDLSSYARLKSLNRQKKGITAFRKICTVEPAARQKEKKKDLCSYARLSSVYNMFNFGKLTLSHTEWNDFSFWSRDYGNHWFLKLNNAEQS